MTITAQPPARVLDYGLALRAHSGTSWVPEDRAAYEVKSYAENIAAFVAQAQAVAASRGVDVGPLLSVYQERHYARYSRLLSVRSRMVSAYIAGPSGFPHRQQEKRHDAYGRALNEFVEWDKAARARILRTGQPPRAISSDDPEAVDKVRAKIAGLEEDRTRAKAINKVCRDPKLTEDQKRETLRDVYKCPPRAIQNALQPDWGKPGLPDYYLTNLGAEVRRLEARAKVLEALAVRPEVRVTFAVPGTDLRGYAKENSEENRLQAFFPGKPGRDVLEALPRAGFHWSPSRGCWQRMRGNASLEALARVVGPLTTEDPDAEPAIETVDSAILAVETLETEAENV